MKCSASFELGSRTETVNELSFLVGPFNVQQKKIQVKAVVFFRRKVDGGTLGKIEVMNQTQTTAPTEVVIHKHFHTVGRTDFFLKK